MEWMILPLKRYAKFSGRSRRKEYWMYILFIVIVSLVLSFLDGALGLGGRNVVGSNALPAGGVGYGASTRGGLLANIFSLATIIPSIAVAVRRLHDTDRSGWWVLLPLVPLIVGFGFLFAGIFGQSMAFMTVGGIVMVGALIAAIILLVWYCSDGTRGPNRFGEDPKGDVPADLRRTFE